MQGNECMFVHCTNTTFMRVCYVQCILYNQACVGCIVPGGRVGYILSWGSWGYIVRGGVGIYIVRGGVGIYGLGWGEGYMVWDGVRDILSGMGWGGGYNYCVCVGGGGWPLLLYI